MANEAWRFYCAQQDDKYWRYLVITEWADEVQARCCGALLKAWIQDDGGVRSISLDECEKQRKLVAAADKFPYVLIRFHIDSDRKFVVFQQRTEIWVASGTNYRVVGDGANAELVIDTSADNWQMFRRGIKSR